MRILVVANFSNQRCGFANFAEQTVVALRRAGVDVGTFDGVYPNIYARHQIRREYPEVEPFFPRDVADYDIVHLVWTAMTMNHYSGADWTKCRHVSWWNGGPTNAGCPFLDAMEIRWSPYPREGHHALWYPIPDWVDALPEPDPVFTVGVSTIRGDGAQPVKEICEAHGWVFNAPVPGGPWLSIEDEVRRLARSTVNVCWYHTQSIWGEDRAGAPSTLLASHRPLLINADRLLTHLWEAEDVYHTGNDALELEASLVAIGQDWRRETLRMPGAVLQQFSWTAAAAELIRVWKEALR